QPAVGGDFRPRQVPVLRAAELLAADVDLEAAVEADVFGLQPLAGLAQGLGGLPADERPGSGVRGRSGAAVRARRTARGQQAEQGGGKGGDVVTGLHVDSLLTVVGSAFV